MDRGCLLAVQGEGIVGEDYRVFIADGEAVSQVLVLGRRDPDVGGKRIQLQRGTIPVKIQSQTLHCLRKYIPLLLNSPSVPGLAQPAGLTLDCT